MEDFSNKKKYNRYQNLKKDLYCTNCGDITHTIKNCNDPITSLGVILIELSLNDDIKNKFIELMSRNSSSELDNKLGNDSGSNSDNSSDKLDNKYNILNTNISQNGIIINEIDDIELFCFLKNNVKFLLIRRKHTLGFLEFVRGRYNIDNVDGIIFLFKQMTPYEINLIKTLTFEELWDSVWGENKNKLTYQNEYVQSIDKYKKLKSEENGYLNLNFYVENVSPKYDVPEWGFPKGRRNFKENDKSCAIREFTEETGYLENEIEILDNVNTLDEVFIGTNGINYKHIYYVAVSRNDKIPTLDPENINQKNEIGDIGFYTYDEAVKLIRPYHTERINIMTQLYIYTINRLIEQLKKSG